MCAGCLVFFRVVAIDRRLIRGKFDNNVTAAGLSLSRRGRPASNEVFRAILLKRRGSTGRICLVLLGSLTSMRAIQYAFGIRLSVNQNRQCDATRCKL